MFHCYRAAWTARTARKERKEREERRRRGDGTTGKKIAAFIKWIASPDAKLQTLVLFPEVKTTRIKRRIVETVLLTLIELR